MKGRLVKQFKEMGFRKIEGRKVELYSLYYFLILSTIICII